MNQTYEIFWGENTQWMLIYCNNYWKALKQNCNIWSVCNYLPTIIISNSEACFLILVQISMANIVLLLLKMEVREDMRAAIITASIIPRAPVDRGNRLSSSVGWMSYIKSSKACPETNSWTQRISFLAVLIKIYPIDISSKLHH